MRSGDFGRLELMSSTPSREAINDADVSRSRVEGAWRVWLEALATDAEAVLGASLAYEALDEGGRNAVLDILEKDVATLAVPRIAVFAPLLSVERDSQRRDRIRIAIGSDMDERRQISARALMGTRSDGDQIIVAETHAYLDFVRLTVCRLDPDHGIRWVRSEPLVHARDATKPGTRMYEADLEPLPVRTAVDIIARAIVAQRRRDGVLPPSLLPLLELFDVGTEDPLGGKDGYVTEGKG